MLLLYFSFRSGEKKTSPFSKSESKAIRIEIVLHNNGSTCETLRGYSTNLKTRGVSERLAAAES